ncbi:Aprataxin [Hondaea fermentalgiana]|uniref:Aprataxin n=1 Tax=Hondaea fermentalgiana TaxID=2315210 RepID=A0A2R5G631_9STRA|nr:Aprataxin [Hondaea fermentalgiana]|eukprot:GBG25228.1 Aprataxin [Hondaea fermentalgiana]
MLDDDACRAWPATSPRLVTSETCHVTSLFTTTVVSGGNAGTKELCANKDEISRDAAAPVAGFDFDGCLCTFSRGANTNVPTADNVHQSLVFDHAKAVLEALHARGFRLVIFSNESLARFKNPDPIKDALTRKLGRVDAFLQFVDLPVEVYLATHNDKYRKPATVDINKRGHDAGGTAMWDFMRSDPLKLCKATASLTDPAQGFYVGDAAGRAGDISDGDKRFAQQVGLPFYTPEDFFLRDGFAERLTGVTREAGADPLALQLSVHALECVHRCQTRRDHEGNFPTAREKALALIQRMAQSAEPIDPNEGFKSVLILSNEPSTDAAFHQFLGTLDNLLPSLSSPPACLAFASISTGDFHFDPELAAAVLLRAATRWAQENILPPKTLRLVEPAGSAVLAALRGQGQAVEAATDFSTQLRMLDALEVVEGDVVKQTKVSAIAVGCPRRATKPGENKANVAVHAELRKSGGPSLLEAMPAVADVGEPIVVQLPEDHPLRLTTGAAHVLFTTDLGPSYANSSGGSKLSPASVRFPDTYNPPQGAVQPPSVSWQHALLDYIKTPLAPAFAQGIFYKDSTYTVIYDAYPKARVHLLVLPNVSATGLDVDKMADLAPRHLSALEKLARFCDILADHVEQKFARGERVKVGLHAQPSLRHLHVHIVSQDFDSPALKHKKHWHSFTHKDFFTPLATVVETLRAQGTQGLIERAQRAEAALKGPLS